MATEDGLAKYATWLGEQIKEHQEQMAGLAAERARILQRMHDDGLTFRAIGALVGLTGPRVFSIMKNRKKE